MLQPFDDPDVRNRLCRLAQDVRVNQIGHSVSVDSDSMGTKNPFSGHARSQLTTPSFGLGLSRTSRYSPRSRRSTLNSCPASIRSCCRSSAGNTICPFEDTVVFTLGKISFYSGCAKRLSYFTPSLRPGTIALARLSALEMFVPSINQIATSPFPSRHRMSDLPLPSKSATAVMAQPVQMFATVL